MLIRPATPADDLLLGELQVRAYADQYARKLPDVVMRPDRLADLRDQATKRVVATVLVAEREGEIAGSVALYAWGVEGCGAWIPGASHLRFLAVDARWHGRGFSHALMDAAEHQAGLWGAPAICLHVRRECDGVARLYQARGYRRDIRGDVDRRPVVFLDGYARDLPLRDLPLQERERVPEA